METQFKKTSNFKKYAIISFSVLVVLLVINFGLSMYFKNHFYIGSKINSVNVFGKTVEEIDKEMGNIASNYILEVEGRNDKKEYIKAEEINIEYVGQDESKALKDFENNSFWAYSLIYPKNLNIKKPFVYDDKLLRNKIEKLTFLDSKNIIQPENAKFVYNNDNYEIVKEIEGTKINEDLLYEKLKEAISRGDSKINLDSAEVYEKPKYITTSKNVLDTKEKLDKYLSSKITYPFNGGEEVLDRDVIHDWIIVDDSYKVTFDEGKIKDYVRSVARNYNTFGKNRSFKTSLGTTVKVRGGNYGWLVSVNKEIKEIISLIKEGEIVTREPIYFQTAASHNKNDIGNTYVEINLTEQHLWLYKKGDLIAEGDIVTGNEARKFSTPEGVYRLTYKEKNSTLDGEDYSVPVGYWMPFNGNIGIHDASWRKKFGGKIYLTNGSHGCINVPPSLAKIIYSNITAGTPIICYK